MAKKKRGLKLIPSDPRTMSFLAFGREFENEKEVEKKASEIIEKEIKRLGFKKSDITPLVEEVLFEFHPDLQIFVHNEKAAGAKKQWSKELLARLWYDFFKWRDTNRKKSKKAGFLFISNRPFWKALKKSRRALEEAYEKHIADSVNDLGYSVHFGHAAMEANVFEGGTWEKQFLKEFKPHKVRGLDQ